MTAATQWLDLGSLGQHPATIVGAVSSMKNYGAQREYFVTVESVTVDKVVASLLPLADEEMMEEFREALIAEYDKSAVDLRAA